jgi:F0F1-type ATP synthase delta subunit
MKASAASASLWLAKRGVVMVDGKQFVLPASVAGPTDATRLQRDAEDLDELLRQAAIRTGGAAVKLPKTTAMLDDMAEANRLNLLQAADRRQLLGFLESMRDKAPVVHISFATEPSAAFTAKIVTWLRENVHPLLLVQIGMQPSIAAGCTVRTTNKVFDFSLRQHLQRNRQLLVDALGKIDQPAPVPRPPAPAPAMPTGGQQ